MYNKTHAKSRNERQITTIIAKGPKKNAAAQKGRRHIFEVLTLRVLRSLTGLLQTSLLALLLTCVAGQQTGLL